MKIMSLNVNRFSGMKERDFTNLFENLDECPKANEIIAFVKEFLNRNPDGVAFLHEIPYWKSKGRGKDFKWIGIRSLYQKFCECFSEQYEIFPKQTQEAYSRTLAIVRKDKGWAEAPCIFVNGYQNKYSMLKREDGLCILGIHAPREYSFLEGMEKYVERHKNWNLIILGDFNIATNLKRTKKWAQELEEAKREKDTKKINDCEEFFARQTWLLKTMSNIGYTDAIEGERITYFKAKTTVDHVLVSPTLQGKVAADAISLEPELSDHAVIIVKIEE